MSLTLEDAQVIIAACHAAARAKDSKIGVVVVDRAGYPIASARMDGSAPWAWQVAEAKAVSCVLWQQNGDWLDQYFNDNPYKVQVLSQLPILRGLPIVPFQGALLVMSNSQSVGAVGVSGAVGGNLDMICAQAGLDALSATPRAS